MEMENISKGFIETNDKIQWKIYKTFFYCKLIHINAYLWEFHDPTPILNLWLVEDALMYKFFKYAFMSSGRLTAQVRYHVTLTETACRPGYGLPPCWLYANQSILKHNITILF